jgi:hypothetical protein
MNLLSISINSDTILGLVLPNSSMRSERRRPDAKASIALSSETSSAVFFIVLHRCIYERKDSPFFCIQDLTSSIDAGRLYVEQKFCVN